MKLSIVDLSPVPANGDRHQAILEITFLPVAGPGIWSKLIKPGK